MNTPRGKAWHKRQTNKKVRRVLNNSVDGVLGKTSGKRLNRASWGCGLHRKDIVSKASNNLVPEYVECMSCGEIHSKFA